MSLLCSDKCHLPERSRLGLAWRLRTAPARLAVWCLFICLCVSLPGSVRAACEGDAEDGSSASAADGTQLGAGLPVSAPDMVAVRYADREALEVVLERWSWLVLEPVWQGLALIHGVREPKSLRRWLMDSGAVLELLPVYHWPDSEEPRIADGRLRARFLAGADEEEVVRQAKLGGAVAVRLLRADLGVYELTAPDAVSTAGVARCLASSPQVAWATPDYIFRARGRWEPNDTYFADQWHHDRIETETAWDVERGSPLITLAVLDSGVDIGHPDLVDKIVAPRDTLEQDDDPSTFDAHGTCCAGVAAASGDNGLGVIGVCPGCSLMPVRIMSEQGWSRYGAASDALYWAADNGADIIVNSWSPAQVSDMPPDIDEAIRHVVANGRGGKGVVLVVAVGNEYRELGAGELASHPLVLAVGATGAQDRRERYSNWGDGLDLMAPAAAVTTDLRGEAGYGPGDYAVDFGGTSAACPVVAGVAGLVLSRNPNLRYEQVRAILASTADPVGNVTYEGGWHPQFGHGRVNAHRAVRATPPGDGAASGATAEQAEQQRTEGEDVQPGAQGQDELPRQQRSDPERHSSQQPEDRAAARCSGPGACAAAGPSGCTAARPAGTAVLVALLALLLIPVPRNRRRVLRER